MQLFERMVFMPQMDEISRRPIHVVFEAFAEHLNPKYCILIDVGIVPTETDILRLMRLLDRDPKIASVCEELTTSTFSGPARSRPKITMAAQHFEFGSIDIIPGAFSAYRSEAVKTKEHPLTGEPKSPLVRYFQMLMTAPMDQLNERWTMYRKGAVAKTDVPKTIEGLIRQLRRRLNGTIFAAVYTVVRFQRREVNDSVHPTVRKFFFFFWEFVFIVTVLTLTWMFLSNVYLTFYFIWKGTFRNTFVDSGDEKGGQDVLLFKSLIYLSFLMMGNRPEDVSLVYCVSVFYFGALMAFALILSLILMFSLEIWPNRDENYCDATKEDVADEVKGAEKKTEVLGKSGVPSASTLSARDYGSSVTILMGSECTGTGVSTSKANEVSELPESQDMVLSPTSTGVVANVLHRRNGSGGPGPINNVKDRDFMNAEIEHFGHIISACVVLLRISFFFIDYAMGVNAIHSTVVSVPEGLLLIGLTLTVKHKRMLATNLEGVETIECSSCTCFETDTLVQNGFMNGTATSNCTNVLLCVLLFPHHVCKQ